MAQTYLLHLLWSVVGTERASAGAAGVGPQLKNKR